MRLGHSDDRSRIERLDKARSRDFTGFGTLNRMSTPPNQVLTAKIGERLRGPLLLVSTVLLSCCLTPSATFGDALGLQFEVSSRYVVVDQCADIPLYQTIAGNWQQQVPSLVEVADSQNVLLVNPAVCQADTVITEQPHRWNCGPHSSDRNFARQTIWLIGVPNQSPE